MGGLRRPEPGNHWTPAQRGRQFGISWESPWSEQGMGLPRHWVKAGQLFPAERKREREDSQIRQSHKQGSLEICHKYIEYTLLPLSHQYFRNFTKQNFINLDPISLGCGVEESTPYPIKCKYTWEGHKLKLLLLKNYNFDNWANTLKKETKER